MRILLYSVNYLPELTGIGKYTGEMAEWLVENGVEVRVVTAPPYYPAWRVSPGYSSWRYTSEKIRGVTVRRCPIWIPNKVTGMTRIFHLASFALSSFPIVLRESMRWRPDVIFSIEPPFFCSPGALIAGWFSGANSWLHVQDLEVDAAFALGLLPSGIMRTFAENAENYLLHKYSRVSTISGKMMERIREKRVVSHKLVMFPNWVDAHEIYPLPNAHRFRKELGLSENAFVILYSGSMGEKQGLEIIIGASRYLLNEKDIQIVMCGDGPARERLVRQSVDIPIIRWFPLQPAERLNELLNCADIHLLPQRPGASDLVMPSKITGMLASGRPIVAMTPPDTELWNLVQDTGMAVPPGDAVALSQAIVELANSPELLIRLGSNARKYAEINIAKEKVLTQFMKMLEAL